MNQILGTIPIIIKKTFQNERVGYQNDMPLQKNYLAFTLLIVILR